MDKGISDADFDSYWLDESRNKNRNRIRVGRQYQATVPALLKPGETDGRRCEDLETLKWKPDYEISEEQLDHYLSVAKAVSLFARAINVYQKADAPRCLQSALRGLSEFVTSHHPCHHDDGCKVPNESSASMSTSGTLQSVASNLAPHNSDSKASGASSSSVLGNLGRCEWTPQEADLFAKALEVCGKNFGAIKKEFLPWKPVKSIIEFYYCGKGDIKPTGDSKSPPPSESEASASTTKTECKSSDSPPFSPNHLLQSTSTAESSQTAAVSQKQDKDEKLLGKEEEKCNLADINFTLPKVENFEIMVPPPSTHLSQASHSSPVKGEEKMAATADEESGSTVGSLKFYLGGQLVLKLNAQQEASRKEGLAKCQWVQSVDTPKLLSQSKRLQKYRKKASDSKKNLRSEGEKSSETQSKCPEGSSSPSDRDGTDSERSRTPEVFQAKKAKVKCYPTSSSASSIASCSSMPRLSPKPPWTPPVEMLKWDKSSPGSHQSDEGFAEGSSPKVKHETQGGRLKSDFSRASPVSMRVSPDSGYSYLLPKTKFGKNIDTLTMSGPHPMGITAATQKCSVYSENDIRNYNSRGSKLQAVLLNKEVMRDGGGVLTPKSLWQPGRSSPMAHAPMVSSPVTFSRAADELPLDLSKKITPAACNSPDTKGDVPNEFRSSPVTRPISPSLSRQQEKTGSYANPHGFSAANHSSSTSGQPSPQSGECKGIGNTSASWEDGVRNGKELSVQQNDDINAGVGHIKSNKISTSAER